MSDITPLEAMNVPLYYIAGNAEEAGFETPPNPHGQSLRTWVRTVGGMQKEALVVNAASGAAWRFACDEGAHLGGFNKAPNPLTYLTAGLIASYMNEVMALAKQRSIELRDLQLTLDNYYYREGDFREGSMMSGALAPELGVHCDSGCDDATLNTLLYEAVAASPINGLARGEHPSLFNLVHNGREITPDQVTPLKMDPFPNPGDNFPNLKPMDPSPAVDNLIGELSPEAEGYDSLEKLRVEPPQLAENQHLLHLHATCWEREDGVKVIYKEQDQDAVPEWRYLSEEMVGLGGQGRAPDATSLISAGIGLCFMTQMGRFAGMSKQPMNDYSIIQDTHFSLGGASHGTGQAGTAQPVETHVFIDSDHDDSVAQDILGVAERTCFLHAFCRDDLKPKVRAIKTSRAA